MIQGVIDEYQLQQIDEVVEDTIAPLTVFAPDDRFRASPTLPTVAYIVGILDWGWGQPGSFDGDEDIITCTATFIGPALLLTAAHCLYTMMNPDDIRPGHSVGEWVIDILVIPGADGDDWPYGYDFASEVFVHPHWYDTLDNFWSLSPQQLSSEYVFQRDIGLIHMPDTSLGSSVGWHSMGILSTQALQSPDFTPISFGYPGDKSFGTQWVTGQAQISQVTDTYLFFRQMDVFKGQSGSAVFRPDDASVVGVVSWGDDSHNAAVRLNQDALNFSLAACEIAFCEFAFFVEETPPSQPTPEPPSQPTPEPPPPPPPPPTTNPPSASGAFQTTWARTDQPVAQGQANRTWMWGPAAFSAAMTEQYTEAPGGYRTVQYFDKSRMEITNPNGDPSSIWYVTNGLLVNELMTGRLQLGDNTFVQHQPAQVNVAGDSDDPTGPTYATFSNLRGAPPVAEGTLLTQTIDRNGNVNFDPGFATHNVTGARYVPETNHTVASVFWNFMTSEGLVFDNGSTIWAPMFVNPFYATGYPVTEAYWANVKVGGVYRQVLIQVFERRVLTYTPGNGPGWEVEAGNVGQHYHHWRYNQIPNQ